MAHAGLLHGRIVLKALGCEDSMILVEFWHALRQRRGLQRRVVAGCGFVSGTVSELPAGLPPFSRSRIARLWRDGAHFGIFQHVVNQFLPAAVDIRLIDSGICHHVAQAITNNENVGLSAHNFRRFLKNHFDERWILTREGGE
jgi:hypothetical protein